MVGMGDVEGERGEGGRRLRRGRVGKPISILHLKVVHDDSEFVILKIGYLYNCLYNNHNSSFNR